jgi:hypothetical protein
VQSNTQCEYATPPCADHADAEVAVGVGHHRRQLAPNVRHGVIYFDLVRAERRVDDVPVRVLVPGVRADVFLYRAP